MLEQTYPFTCLAIKSDPTALVLKLQSETNYVLCGLSRRPCQINHHNHKVPGKDGGARSPSAFGWILIPLGRMTALFRL